MATTIKTIETPKRARALDTSGNNNPGQIYSGRALEFDGVTDYLLASTAFSETTHTVCVWAYVIADSDTKYIFDSRGGNNDGILLAFTSTETLQYSVNSND